MEGAFAPFAALMAGMVGSRVISEAALRKLTTEQKGSVVSALAPLRMLSLGSMLVIVTAAFWSTWVLVVGLPLYALTVSVMSFRALTAAAIPASYVKANVVASAVMTVGIPACVGLLIS